MAASLNHNPHLFVPDSLAEPNDQYSDRLPSPPHINIPVTAFSGEPPPPNFVATPDGLFNDLYLGPDWARSEWADWDYERRRDAQPILPFLLLGPTLVAKDSAYLRSHAITMTVVVRHARPGQASAPPPAAARAAAAAGIPCELVDVFDNQGLAARIAGVSAAVTSHLRATKVATGRLGRVLLADDSGNERAAALAVAYVMEVSDYSLVAACQLVQRQRFCANIDDALRFTLQAYEDVLRARRDVGGLRASSRLADVHGADDAHARRSSSKRPREAASTDDDGDVAMDAAVPVAAEQHEAQGRVFAPFANG